MNNWNEVTNAEGYTISTNPSLLDVAAIHQFLSTNSYWAANIPLSVVATSVANSLCFGVYFKEEQIGFARLITDKATFAYLADVYILNEHRGKGLSKWLITIIQGNSQLQGLRRWLLATKDAHGLYAQLGWQPFTEEQSTRLMQRYTPNIYE